MGAAVNDAAMAAVLFRRCVESYSRSIFEREFGPNVRVCLVIGSAGLFFIFRIEAARLYFAECPAGNTIGGDLFGSDTRAAEDLSSIGIRLCLRHLRCVDRDICFRNALVCPFGFEKELDRIGELDGIR